MPAYNIRINRILYWWPTSRKTVTKQVIMIHYTQDVCACAITNYNNAALKRTYIIIIIIII